MMKKPIIYFATLLIITLHFYSCANDDDTTITPPPTGETLDITAIIEAITTNSSNGIWETQQATLIKQSNDNVNLTGTYMVQDDVFTFTSGANQSINLQWKKGFDINMQALTIQEAGTDRNASTENFTLTIDSETGVLSSPDTRVTGNYDVDSGEIIILIEDQNSNDILSLNLTVKNMSDYVSIPATLSSPEELFSFSTGIPRVGCKVSQSQNSIYLTNRNDLAGLGAQQAFKYDLTSDAVSSFTFTQQDFATKNIEFLENQIVSIGGNHFENMDYDFLGVFPYTPVDNPAVSNGTASLDDTAYLFGGLVNGSETAISTWNMGNATFQDIATLPVSLNDMDGEIVDQVLYMFGGWDTPSSSDPGSTMVYTLHIDSGVQEQLTIPVNLRETYTSIVENIIYVGGLQPIDSDNDGQFDDLNPYLGAFNTIDNSFQEITLNMGDVLDNKRLVHLQVVDNTAYFITSETLGAPDGYINRVYKATLNE